VTPPELPEEPAPHPAPPQVRDDQLDFFTS
jgi:hypothetical protein